VEDQIEVLSLTLAVLKGQGYRTRGAATVAEALEMCCVPACADVIITDLVMPGMSGRVLAERLKALCPSAKVIYTSGYSDEVLSERGLLSSGDDYLQKPVPAPVLLKKVRAVLASKATTNTVDSSLTGYAEKHSGRGTEGPSHGSPEGPPAP
jgi:CheY-like chemotaxis protein